eukprot:CAMPEP_0113973598 /NCGR_PEP_ID=MMETSP0011_2-20120614/14580_1 /TAXON_ID=101924 /ORGANISM="Rhodosorus marinus" /LENGTH=278 /DNA_ID=CAMNT_0000991621 /DNA_START=176 /DNA_END=1012 /DNA_ORIENTATION=+ /assembly_acc=CAM_ASM_000156
MSEKVALVTGSTDGIGLHTLKNLAKMGYVTLVHGRNPEKVKAVGEMIKSEGGVVQEYVADFASLAQVRRLAEEVAERNSKIDVLINNAGVFEVERRTSADGYEMTFAVNVLAPFLLTSLLMKTLKAAPAARIINVASISHMQGGAGRRGGEIDFDNLQHESGYDVYGAYGLSKLSLIAFTNELADRLRGSTITANACDPGTVNTKMLLSGWGRVGMDVSSANNETFLATDPSLEGVSGKYFVSRRETKAAFSTYDEQVRRKLWEQLETLTQATYSDLP